MSEDKNSAIDVIKTLHETVNLTFSSLDQKIANLEKEFSERRHRAMEALHALNGGEQCIDGSYVDGYDPQKKIIYKFMGCVRYGCDKCYICLTPWHQHENSLRRYHW